VPEQRPCQVVLGGLQGKVPGMPDEASAGLEEPLLGRPSSSETLSWVSDKLWHCSRIVSSLTERR
jgi:hypothetical protein